MCFVVQSQVKVVDRLLTLVLSTNSCEAGQEGSRERQHSLEQACSSQ